jgi:hypothetical protein
MKELLIMSSIILKDDMESRGCSMILLEQYNTLSQHGSRNGSLMSSITQELLMEGQYNVETSLVSCCFETSKIPQYNGSSGKDANI